MTEGRTRFAAHLQLQQVRGRSLSGVLSAVLLALFAVAGMTALSARSTSAAEPGTAGLRIVHGLRGVVADVYLDNALVLQTFAPDRSTALMRLTPGDHQIDVRLSGTAATSAPMISKMLPLVADQDMSVVLHLSASDQPTISAFIDDTSSVPAGQTRVVVRHTASAPPIDVRLDDNAIAANLANPQEISSQLPAGTYQISVDQAGTTQILAPLQAAPLAEGAATDMYFVGDQSAGTLGWIAVQIPNLATAPALIQTGDSGLLAPAARSHRSRDLAVASGLVLVMLGGVVVRRRRRTARG